LAIISAIDHHVFKQKYEFGIYIRCGVYRLGVYRLSAEILL